jgi:hypothetical protein
LESSFHSKCLSVADPLGLLPETLRGGVWGQLTHALHDFDELFHTELAGRGIKSGSERGCDSIPLPFPDVAFRKVTVVENDTICTRSEACWDGEVHAIRIDISKVMNRDRRLVRHHPKTAAPKRPSNEIVVVTHGPLGEAIDAPSDALPVALRGVICLLRVGVTKFKRLGSGEVAALSGSETTKLVI